jgi:hypothetical protein
MPCDSSETSPCRQDHWEQNGCGRIMCSRTMGRIRMGPGTTWCAIPLSGMQNKVGRVPWDTEFRRCKTGRFEITARRDRQSSTRGGASPERPRTNVRGPQSHEVASRRPPGRAGVPPQTIIERDQLALHSRATDGRGDGGSTATAERARPGYNEGSGEGLRSPRRGRGAEPRLSPPMLRSPIRLAELRVRLRLSLCSKTTP